MKKLIGLLAAVTALVLANFSAPAMATPINTVFDRTVSGCDFEFMFGNLWSVPYSEVRVAGADPSGYQCRMYSVWVLYAKGADSDLNYATAPFSACGGTGDWCDNNVWHNVTGPSGWSAYAANYQISTSHNGCNDSWQLEASIYVNEPEGHWTRHTQVGC